MTPETFSGLEVRRAAKAIIRTDDERLVFVAGKRGMLNLPGGGIDRIETPDGVHEETPIDALYRELKEELGVGAEHLADLQEACGTWDIVTPESGPARRAVWSVFTGKLEIPASELAFPKKSEITAIGILTPAECLAHPNMSKLAKHAVRHVLVENSYTQ